MTSHQPATALLSGSASPFAEDRLNRLLALSRGLAHDLNSALTAVVCYADLAKQNLPGLPRHATAYQNLVHVIEAAQLATGLAQQLLAHVRNEDDDCGPSDVNACVQLTVRSVGVLLSRAHVCLDLGGGVLRVNASNSRVNQVVMNLVLNAAQAIPTNGGAVIVRTLREHILGGRSSRGERVDGVSDGIFVRIEVEDNGAGMDPDVLDHIFDPYFTTKPNGNGLGMSVVKSIVHHGKGAIMAQSERGRGTLFVVLLPELS
jgi:signal transduction histidine kinase